MSTAAANGGVWRGMTRTELDAAYDNGNAVANTAQKIADWSERSARLRGRFSDTLDLPYGPRERNRIDVFPCGTADAPLFVFIHGGYWQRHSKDVFSCMAEGPLAHGFDVALIGYTLAPDATLTDIVAETHAALRWLRREGPRHGVGRGKLIVSGWSAGGHLTAMAIDIEAVDGGLAISGIFDVEPCRLNYLNDKLGLTAEEARAMSPLLQLPTRRGKPLTVAYGTAELPELQRQSQEYWQASTARGLPVTVLPLAEKNHFTILDELTSPNGQLTSALRSLVG